MKVAATSRPVTVAGAIAHTIRESGEVSVRAIGAGAVNQAVKAVCYAREYLLEDEDPTSIFCIPTLVELELDGQERTAVELIVQKAGAADDDVLE
jgi:stage V sporulation protein S